MQLLLIILSTFTSVFLTFLYYRLRTEKSNESYLAKEAGSIPGIVNFRSAVNKLVYRCGINSPTHEDITTLEQKGIKTLLDLRLDKEINAGGLDLLKGKFGDQYHHCNLMGTNFESGVFKILPLYLQAAIMISSALGWKGRRFKLTVGFLKPKSLYFHSAIMLEFAKPEISQALQSLLIQYDFDWDEKEESAIEAARERNLPAVVFCSVGKDRTGLISALLQLIAGYNHDQIVKSYTESEANLQPYMVYLNHVMQLTGLNPNTMLGSPIECIEAILEHIGDWRVYLESIGIDMRDIVRLEKILA